MENKTKTQTPEEIAKLNKIKMMGAMAAVLMISSLMLTSVGTEIIANTLNQNNNPIFEYILYAIADILLAIAIWIIYKIYKML